MAADRALDRPGFGPQWLRDPRIGALVVESIQIGESRSCYELDAWVVMPNHVHLSILPRMPVPAIMRWLKSWTARQANQLLRRSGVGWVGGIRGAAGLVKRGRAGGTACPTTEALRHSRFQSGNVETPDCRPTGPKTSAATCGTDVRGRLSPDQRPDQIRTSVLTVTTGRAIFFSWEMQYPPASVFSTGVSR